MALTTKQIYRTGNTTTGAQASLCAITFTALLIGGCAGNKGVEKINSILSRSEISPSGCQMLPPKQLGDLKRHATLDGGYGAATLSKVIQVLHTPERPVQFGDKVPRAIALAASTRDKLEQLANCQAEKLLTSGKAPTVQQRQVVQIYKAAYFAGLSIGAPSTPPILDLRVRALGKASAGIAPDAVLAYALIALAPVESSTKQAIGLARIALAASSRRQLSAHKAKAHLLFALETLYQRGANIQPRRLLRRYIKDPKFAFKAPKTTGTLTSENVKQICSDIQHIADRKLFVRLLPKTSAERTRFEKKANSRAQLYMFFNTKFHRSWSCGASTTTAQRS